GSQLPAAVNLAGLDDAKPLVVVVAGAEVDKGPTGERDRDHANAEQPPAIRHALSLPWRGPSRDGIVVTAGEKSKGNRPQAPARARSRKAVRPVRNDVAQTGYDIHKWEERKGGQDGTVRASPSLIPWCH